MADGTLAEPNSDLPSPQRLGQRVADLVGCTLKRGTHFVSWVSIGVTWSRQSGYKDYVLEQDVVPFVVQALTAEQLAQLLEEIGNVILEYDNGEMRIELEDKTLEMRAAHVVVRIVLVADEDGTDGPEG